MNPEAKKIVFLCDANHNIGLGHVFRCVNLAEILKENNFEIQFWGDYNEFVKQVLAEHGFQYQHIQLHNLVTDEQHEKIDYLVIDTYLKTIDQIEVLCEKYRAIFIDDFFQCDFKNAYGVINFTIYGKIHVYHASNNLLGLHYFPFKPELKTIREHNLQKPVKSVSEYKNILVLLSGTGLEEKKIGLLMNVLDDLFFDTTITLLMNKEINKIDLKNNTFQHHKYTTQIEDLYRVTDLIISGGGLAKYEAAFCSIPNFSFAITADQQSDTIGFTEKNLTFEIGTYYEYDPADTKNKIKEYIDTPQININFRKASKELFDSTVLSKDIIQLFSKI